MPSRLHPAAYAIALAVALAGCTANQIGIPDFPLGPPEKPIAKLGSIKGELPFPAPKQPTKIAISSVAVEGVASEAAAGLTNAIRAELATAGYVLGQPGYKLFANVATADTGIRITWSVLDTNGKVVGTVEQANNVLPRVLEPGRNTHAVAVAKAALPGLMKHLPPPK